MLEVLLLAQGNNDVNGSLSSNPLVLGLIFVAIGLGVGGWGLYEFVSGVAYSKYGKAMSGTTGKVVALIRMVVGVFCIGFGLYKAFAG